ncbi:MAG: hypothetical protein QXP70_05080 [Methanomassiliicoccales archaeon]
MRAYSWEKYEPLSMVKLGVAIAEYFGGQKTVATGRDGHGVSRFCRRCLVSGMVSTGTQVLDFRVIPSQAIRYGVVTQKLDGAAYVSYFQKEIQVHVYDERGRNLPAEGILKIRDILQEISDVATSASDVGSLMQYTNGIEDYVDYLRGLMTVRKSGKWLIDAQSDPISLVVEPLFVSAGIECRIFNPMLVGDGEIRSREEFMNEFSRGGYSHGMIIERDELLGATYFGSDGSSKHFSSFEELVKGVFSR